MGKAQDILNGVVKLTISAAKTIYNSYQKEVTIPKLHRKRWLSAA